MKRCIKIVHSLNTIRHAYATSVQSDLKEFETECTTIRINNQYCIWNNATNISTGIFAAYSWHTMRRSFCTFYMCIYLNWIFFPTLLITIFRLSVWVFFVCSPTANMKYWKTCVQYRIYCRYNWIENFNSIPY